MSDDIELPEIKRIGKLIATRKFKWFTTDKPLPDGWYIVRPLIAKNDWVCVEWFGGKCFSVSTPDGDEIAYLGYPWEYQGPIEPQE